MAKREDQVAKKKRKAKLRKQRWLARQSQVSIPK
jgi:hypothetical protein